MAADRRLLLEKMLEVASQSRVADCLPTANMNQHLDIIPLRIVWSQPNGVEFRKSIARVINILWTWFAPPIVSTSVPLENFGYFPGTCPNSEPIGLGMVNFPCNIPPIEFEELVAILDKVVCKEP